MATFLRQPQAIAPGSVLDNISLSAAAQQFISTANSAFPARSGALQQLASGNVSTFGVGDYSGAAFIGQNLQGAVFDGAILANANFSSANLQGAKFTNALVTGANFTQADLRGADLRDAQGLVFQQIQGATFDQSTLLPTRIGANIFGTFDAHIVK
jgi:uncharacterized protein YjbI with pentapeptide repeats